MAKVELELKEKTLEAARRSAQAGHITVEQWLTEAIERTAATPPDTLLGLFSDAPELMDAVTADAMATRGRYPMRQPKD